MSEPGVTSDKTRGKSRGNARTCDYFGQNQREELGKYPNLGYFVQNTRKSG